MHENCRIFIDFQQLYFSHILRFGKKQSAPLSDALLFFVRSVIAVRRLRGGKTAARICAYINRGGSYRTRPAIPARCSGRSF